MVEGKQNGVNTVRGMRQIKSGNGRQIGKCDYSCYSALQWQDV